MGIADPMHHGILSGPKFGQMLLDREEARTGGAKGSFESATSLEPLTRRRWRTLLWWKW